MRKRDLRKLDRIVEAAAMVFARTDYSATRVTTIAEHARVGPGTVYLYCADKESLLELAFLRACESPLVAVVSVPYRGSVGPARIPIVRSAVEAISHFPQLWVAAQRRNVSHAETEYEGILLEISSWIARYRFAIRIADRTRRAWPEYATAFDELIWPDLHRRLASYLRTRVRTGALPGIDRPDLVATAALAGVSGSVLGSAAVPEPEDPGGAGRVAARVLGYVGGRPPVRGPDGARPD